VIGDSQRCRAFSQLVPFPYTRARGGPTRPASQVHQFQGAESGCDLLPWVLSDVVPIVPLEIDTDHFDCFRVKLSRVKN